MHRNNPSRRSATSFAANMLVLAWSLIMVGVGLGALGDWHYHADARGGFIHTHGHLGGHRHSDDPGAPTSGETDPSADTVELPGALAAMIDIRAPMPGLERRPELSSPVGDSGGRSRCPSRNLHLRGPPI